MNPQKLRHKMKMENRILKILVIDDNQDNIICLKALINDIFPDVLTYTASNGTLGLELAAAENPDVILLDIVMPVMDGFEVCKRLKSDRNLRDIPVVFITALRDDKQSRISALETGAEAFLSKPIEENELTAQIKAMVKIKTANIEKRFKERRLTALVEEQTRELNITYTATLNLLEDVRKENEARKESEEALRESEERYKRITAGLTDYLYTVKVEDGKATETHHSDACLTVTGYSANEFKTDPYLWINMVLPEERDFVAGRFMKILEGKDLPPFEHHIVCKDGSIRWISDTAIPKYDSNGILVSYDGVIKDITDRKLAEEEIKKLNEELERRVIIRTAQLEAANKELEAFSYSVSHDLRAPLRHINGFANILMSEYYDELPPDARHYMNTITDSARKMGTLIDDLLSFSRTGRAEMNKTSFIMGQVVEESLSQIKPLAINRNIEYQISHLPEVFCDYNLIRQVWVNLLDNAVKYTKPRDKAEIKIGFDENKEEFIFFVSDNGVGFDMNYSQKLFGVFQRLHTSDQFYGTGIGLANVRRIISRHDGKTWAKAEVEKGATFYFSIPKIWQ
jgi:PAS domain S-box-containing protein